MISSAESSNVIGAPDAAGIPKPLQGRAIAKKSGRLVPIQSAYSEAPYQGDKQPDVMVKPFVIAGEPADTMQRTLVFTGGAFTESVGTGQRATNQLDRVLQAIAQIGAAPGRSPWQAPLAEEITLAEAKSQFDIKSDPQFPAVVGVLDDPENQQQLLCQFDLAYGALFAFGGAGSGKSTLLETVATAASLRALEDNSALSLIVFDYASRSLTSLKNSPHMSLYADGDDLEATTRAIALVEEEVARRRSRIGSENEAPEFDPILLIIDGWENLDDTLRPTTPGGQDLHVWFDKFESLVVQGRQYGIYTVAATGQQVKSKLMSSIPHRLVLRQSGENEYRSLGLSSKLTKDLTLRPGQAIDPDGALIQVAITHPTDDVDNVAGRVSLEIAPPLPTNPELAAGPSSAGPPVVGVADLTNSNAPFDPSLGRLLVLGPPRSGKSSVLTSLGQQMRARGYDTYVIGSERSTLNDESFGWTNSVFGDAVTVAAFVEEHPLTSGSTCLIFDDLEEFDSREVYAPFESLVGQASVVFGSTVGVRRVSTQNPAFTHTKNGRANLILQSTSREINEALGARVEIRPGLKLLPGRGVLIIDRQPQFIQCFQHSASASLAAG